MSVSVGARPNVNNPGDITVTGPNATNVYQGQTGVLPVTGPDGTIRYFPTFDTPQDGTAALDQYLAANIGSNNTTSLTTPTQLANYFLSGPNANGGNLDNPITPTTANPGAINWLNQVESATGLGPNGQLSSVSLSSIAQGVSAGEGTISVYVPTASATQNTSDTSGSLGGVSSILTAPAANATASATVGTGANGSLVPSQGAIATDDPGLFATLPANVKSGASPVAAGTNSGVAAPSTTVTDVVNGAVKWFEGIFSAATAERFSAAFIGIGFIIVAVIAFVLSTNAGQQAVKSVKTAALAAA